MGHEPLERRQLDAARLPPPLFRHPHKQKLNALLTAPPRGTLRYSRWAARPLPAELPPKRPAIEIHAGVYDYRGGDGVWQVNFADPNLFFAWSSSLLAQDELQALEHPQLGPLREALLAEGLPALTEENGQPTPVLVAGVERRLALDTAPDLDRPRGLYGREFAAASFESVRAAVTLLEPPSVSHLIAMAAPVGGGVYTLPQLEQILATAYTAFAAAVEESRALWPGSSVEVNTGFWGCGAFGGNRAVMVALQLLGARLAGVDRLRFHTVTQAGVQDFEVAPRLAEAPVAAMLQELLGRGYRWGVSDGN
jgi:hypothetical protein